MRRAVLLAACLMASACAPEVVAGAYFCGPEELCPDDFVCDGATNICVSERDATEFACGASTENEPNDSAATAEAIGDVSCTALVEATGCIGIGGDLQDYYRFTVPDCGPRNVTTNLLFPVAFEPLLLVLLDDAGAAISVEPCPLGVDENGQSEECVRATPASGGTFVLRVSGLGSQNCDGACAHNRYGLAIQISPQ